MLWRGRNVLGSKGKKGAAIVEFAIVVPLLILLAFGAIEFGVLLYDKAMITNASREGARAGVVFNRLTAAQINTVVQQYAGNNLITFGNPAAVTVTLNPAAPENLNPGQLLTVTVSYNFTFLITPSFTRIFGVNLANGINLTATTVMRAE